MSLNLLPGNWGSRARTIGLSIPSLSGEDIGARAARAHAEGFSGLELPATGEPGKLYAPSVRPEERARWRDLLAPFHALSAVAPDKSGFDVSLVSPSAVIRRASVTEIWSVCRFIEALGGGVVSVRTGWPPAHVEPERARGHLVECLTTLDRMAGDHNAVIGLEAADYFDDASRFDLLEMVRLRHTGITLDTRHVSLLRDALAEDGAESVVGRFARRFAARLVHVRVHADEPFAPGLSEDDVADLVAALLEANYRGMTCLAFGADFPPREHQVRAQQRAAWEKRMVGAADDR
uniref:Xylose isomerase-like TIM barrel domain-containing protein n=1 Tax=uncultured Armatimonadetes bacterium TaxID=157466 RepID=A0A6J4JHQ2_9BACT|nr:hypothetical protein AVDCRST_MAG63-3447 [uncultured Armatimonadetes bacterium]